MTIKFTFDPVDIATSIIDDCHVYRLSKGREAQLISWDLKSGFYVVENERLELEAQFRLTECTTLKTVKDRDVQEVIKAIRRNAQRIAPKDINNPDREIIV